MQQERSFQQEQLRLHEKHDAVDEDTDETTDEVNQRIPAFAEGDKLHIADIIVKDGKTKPKSRFTTASLLDYMKVHNIGTGATRDKIISELTQRRGRNADSAVRRDGKHFISTQFGREMDSCIPEHLKSIDFLKQMERRIGDIAEGKLALNDFLQMIRQEFEENLAKMKEQNPSGKMRISTGRKQRNDMICPACGNPLAEFDWGYSCSTWKKDGSGCNFSIGRKQFNKTITEKVIRQLIEYGETKDELQHLKGKSGKAFDARLTLEIAEDGKARVMPKF